ncbi:hypothetical protein SUGI_1161860 [Cryptomeria japonica]|nr:hypothetical protein SUGI_1161860 [Cryptomeria japonica]
MDPARVARSVRMVHAPLLTGLAFIRQIAFNGLPAFCYQPTLWQMESCGKGLSCNDFVIIYSNSSEN